MTLGLFGGTFDPIHCGHLDVARAAQQALGLDAVWFIPARYPPHRTRPQASAAHRFAMTALAVAPEPTWLVSDVEMDVDGPSYTVETLDRLDARGLSGAGLFFITGADAFKEIASWKAYPALLDRCHFVVVSRPGCPATSMRTELPALAPRMLDTPCAVPARASIFLVDAPTAPVSSTRVRQALAGHEPLEGLIPAPVATYIERQGLYPTRQDAQGHA